MMADRDSSSLTHTWDKDNTASHEGQEARKVEQKVSIRKPTEMWVDDCASANDSVRSEDLVPSIITNVVRVESVKPSLSGFHESKDMDVLSGRGGGTNLHPGNRYFRQLIVSHSDSYDKASKAKKPFVARDVVRKIRERGGRFLRKDNTTGLFYEIGDELAREKASQAFRHRTFELRKKQGLNRRVVSSLSDVEQRKRIGRHSSIIDDDSCEDEICREEAEIKKQKKTGPIPSFSQQNGPMSQNDDYHRTNSPMLTAEEELSALARRVERRPQMLGAATRANSSHPTRVFLDGTSYLGARGDVAGNESLTNLLIGRSYPPPFLPAFTRRATSAPFDSFDEISRMRVTSMMAPGVRPPLGSSSSSSIFVNPRPTMRRPNDLSGSEFRGVASSYHHRMYDASMDSTTGITTPPATLLPGQSSSRLFNPYAGGAIIGTGEARPPWSLLPSSYQQWNSDHQNAASSSSVAYERRLLNEYLSMRVMQQERGSLLDMIAERRGLGTNDEGQRDKEERL